MTKIHKLIASGYSHEADSNADDYILCDTESDDPNFSTIDKMVDCKRCLKKLNPVYP